MSKLQTNCCLKNSKVHPTPYHVLWRWNNVLKPVYVISTRTENHFYSACLMHMIILCPNVYSWWLKLSLTWAIKYDSEINHTSFCTSMIHHFFVHILQITHDDVIKWKHFLRHWPFVRGIHRSSVNSPHRGQWRGALKFFFICTRINGWVNNREAGDLRRHCAHYDVIVMGYFTDILLRLGMYTLFSGGLAKPPMKLRHG